MSHGMVRGITVAFVLAMGITAHAQQPGTRTPEDSGTAGESQPAPSSPSPAVDEGDSAKEEKESKAAPAPENFLEWLTRPLSQQEDRDGPINTDRPTFTPANTVVPPGRLQFESGFTFNRQQTGTTRSNVYDFPELAVRYGLMDRVEFRTFWLGQTYTQIQAGPGRSWRNGVGGPSDMEIGFKWQLFPGDTKRKWIPTTALITSIYTPTGGSSYLSSQTVEPYINLIYGWSLNEKLTLSGCVGYLGMRQLIDPYSGRGYDNFQRFHQSLVAFYSATERTTLFYEWYIFELTNSTDNRPQNFMDGGLLYRPTPNTQIDLRAGFGLSGRPDDFFTGVGFSWRF
jgi:Putative MetA-pathway of phenol degradation